MTLSHKILSLIAAVALTVTAACSRADHFTVEGNIPDLADGEVSLTYYTSSAVRNERVMASAGHFKLRGESPDYAMAELRMGRRVVPLTFIVHDGDKIKVKGQSPDSVTLSGSKAVKEITSWQRDNADVLRSASADSINALVEAYIADKGATPAGAWMVLTHYNALTDAAGATSIYAAFAAEEELMPLMTAFADMVTTSIGARNAQRIYTFNLKGASDSMVMYMPSKQSATLLVFTDRSGNGDRRTLCSSLRGIDTLYTPARLRILEMSLARDSAAWRQAIKADTLVTWSRMYLPAGVATGAIRGLNVPRLPFYIVTDSTGTQRYRGISLSTAADTVAAIARRK